MDKYKLAMDCKVEIGDINKDIYDIWSLYSNIDGTAIRIIDDIMIDIDNYYFNNGGVDIVGYIEEISDHSNNHKAICELLLSNLRMFGNCGSILKPKIAKFNTEYEDIGDKLRIKYYDYIGLIVNRDIKIVNNDYEWALRDGGSSTFVVLDPPYLDVRTSKEYYKGNHFNFDYTRFRNLLRNTKCKFLITCDLGMKEYVKEFNCLEYDIRYKMGKKRLQKEMLVTNY